MGGGDLNVKKSWHVSNFNNIERVYLAEQRDAAEKRKIAELIKERAEQARIEDLQAHAVATGAVKKKQERVEFLYQGSAPQIDREAYILGKKIDKAVEIESKDDLDIGNKPGAAFVQGSANSAMDLSKKVRDDPLFAIKRKEQEGVRSVLNNPVRMKQLMDLRMATKSKKSKKDKKGKKEKKEKKEKKGKRERREVSRDRSSSPEGVSRRRSPSPRRGRPDSPRGGRGSPPRGDRHDEAGRGRGGYRGGYDDRRGPDDSRNHSPPARAVAAPRRRSRSRSPPRRRPRSRSPADRSRGRRSRSRSPPRRRPPPASHSSRQRSSAPAKDDEAERLRKLEEMKANAAWHDDLRSERAADHARREEEQAKRDAQRETDGFGRAAFMDEFNRDSYNSAASGTVADRLNRNRHYIQRTSAALDSQSFKR